MKKKKQKLAKFEFESLESNPENGTENRACVLVTLPGGEQFDVQIDATEFGIDVQLIDYIGLNTIEAFSAAICQLGMEE